LAVEATCGLAGPLAEPETAPFSELKSVPDAAWRRSGKRFIIRGQSMLTPGEVLDHKYRIVRLLGEGGMGAVFEAEAIRLHRRVAIKVLHAGSASEGEMAARFQLEAQAAGRIGSRHIVEVIDLGHLPSGAHFMVMEFLDGQSLRERIAKGGPMSAAQLYPIAAQLVVGVGAAHAAGIIHRDLKPDNVHLVRQADGADFVKILDFGISKFKGAQSSPDSSGLSLTRTGALMGTPYYLSPEQASGAKSVDERTDLYTLGVIFYECITGVVPHAADTFNQLLFSIVLEPPPPISSRVPGADLNFVAFVERAMAKDPKLRFQSAEEMSAALQAWARGEPLAARFGVASAEASAQSAEAGGSSGGAQRHVATVASAPERTPENRTLESWSHSGRVSSADIGSELRGRRRKLPLVLVAVAVLALAGVGLALARRAGDVQNAANVPASADALPTALPEKPVSTAPDTAAPRVDPVSPLPTSLPVAEPAGRDASRSEPSAAPAVAPAVRPRAHGPARAEAAPAASPSAARIETPPQAPATAPAPAAPAADADVSRIRGGRTIRNDL
jgi:serine/threonine protein kinase